MSTELLEIKGGPLTTNHLKVTRYCCAKSIVDQNLATSRKSLALTIHTPGHLEEIKHIRLTNNQAIILAEAILKAIK